MKARLVPLADAKEIMAGYIKRIPENIQDLYKDTIWGLSYKNYEILASEVRPIVDFPLDVFDKQGVHMSVSIVLPNGSQIELDRAFVKEFVSNEVR